MHQPVSNQQYILQLAPGPSYHDDDRFATRLMSTILGDDSGSRMYWEFLDTGFAESAGIGGYEYDGSGSIMTFLCCDPERAQENLERLMKLQRKVKAEGVTERELELAKRKVASHIVLASERTETRMFSVGSQWLTGLPYRTAAEIASSYEAVSLSQVNAALEKWSLDTNMTLVVGPCEDLVAAV